MSRMRALSGRRTSVLGRIAYLGAILSNKLFGRPARRRALARNGDHVLKSAAGPTFYIRANDEICRQIATEGLFERKFLEFVAARLPSDAVVLDIGANIGNHALYLARYASVVHCFEPNPMVIADLERNIALNHAANVIVHPFGMGSSDGEFPFIVNTAGNVGASGFAATEHARNKPLSSELTTLPIRHAGQAIAELDLRHIDFIKIDVEGMELDVIRAMKEIIDQFRPIISFEYHGHLVDPSTFDDIRLALPGYIIANREFVPPGEGGLSTLPLHWAHGGQPPLRQVEQPGRRSYENLLAIPKEAELAAEITD